MKLLLALLITLPAYSATVASLQLKGTVPVKLSVSIVPETIALTLPLDVSQTGTLISTVTEKSNNSAGYKITITSENLGNLKNGTELFPYSLTYGGENVTLELPTEFTRTNRGTTESEVRITYTGTEHDDLVSGDYTDSVTFTIQAN